MNIQHSSRTDLWYTPKEILSLVKKVLGSIDFDPASDLTGNTNVQAKIFLTKQDDGLVKDWSSGSIFCNPPGGKSGGKSNMGAFWKKFMEHRAINKDFTHGIFLAFSLEALQVTQDKDCKAIAEFPFCVPSKRIRFVDANGDPGEAPSHSNMIIYVPGSVNETDKFYEVFKSLGCVLNTKRHP